MNKLKNMLSKIVPAKAIFKVKAQSPKLLFGVGAVGIIAGTVLACRATLKVQDQLAEDYCEIEEIKDKNPDDKKAIVKAYAKAGTHLVGAYILPGTFIISSLYLIKMGGRILEDQNTNLLRAYNSAEAIFNRYRNRVIDEYGEETDRMFYHNIRRKDIEIEENGKTKKIKNADVLDEMDDPLEVSYDRVFDDNNSNWTGHSDMDLVFLKHVENWANEVLKARGFIFLNEVYNELGFGPCEAGQFVGWVRDHNGDGYVDFGIMDIYRKSNRDFINGYSQHVLLTFNVDGYIANKI